MPLVCGGQGRGRGRGTGPGDHRVRAPQDQRGTGAPVGAGSWITVSVPWACPCLERGSLSCARSTDSPLLYRSTQAPLMAQALRFNKLTDHSPFYGPAIQPDVKKAPCDRMVGNTEAYASVPRLGVLSTTASGCEPFEEQHSDGRGPDENVDGSAWKEVSRGVARQARRRAETASRGN